MQQPPPQQQRALTPPASLSSSIPQFVVIHDQLHQSWKHPIVHYVFEDEPFPANIPKDCCVLVNFSDDGETVKDAYSLSHRFQVTNCKISSTPQIGGGKETAATSLMLTIEGMSAAKLSTDPHSNPNPFLYQDDIDQTSTVFGLDELLLDYKRRNELLRQTLGSPEQPPR